MWRMMQGPMQWRVLWIRHAKFMVGVTGVARDGDGKVLLLRHRFWPEGRQWGLPSGYANKGETFEETIVREGREENGQHVRVHDLSYLKSRFQLRIDDAYEAEFIEGMFKTDALEIVEAGWFSPDSLPGGLQDSHRLLIHGGCGL